MDNPDPFFFEHLLTDVEVTSLLVAVKDMEHALFYHPAKKGKVPFRFDLISAALDGCLLWAEKSSPEDVRHTIDKQLLAAIRAWTCTPVCYVLTSLLRDPHRSRQSVQPVLRYARLFFAGLHALPRTPEYIIVDATLYRGEHGVRTTWEIKIVPGGNFSFFVPTSFSLNPAVVQRFMDASAARTVYIIHGASGWNLVAFSPYEEVEVLIEPVSNYTVIRAETFDASHRLVQMGQIKAGLHLVEGRVVPGVELLEGSAVKENESESFRRWQQQEEEQKHGKESKVPELELYPFTEKEWEAKGKKVPTRDKERRMSLLGKGAFMSTFRMWARANGVGYAVKEVQREDMEAQGITEEQVRKEAQVLEMMRHKHVIRYVGLVETDEEMWLVMELAEGGSLADLIKARGGGQGVEVGEVWAIAGQLASGLDYIHTQGIVHRDVKADNILLARAYSAGTVCVKLADFGVAEVLATAAGSALMSKVGTASYLSPERGRGLPYGTKADMWAAGCVLIELVHAARLQSPLWDSGPAVSARREQMVREVRSKEAALGEAVEGLLHMDKNARMSALGLKALADKRAQVGAGEVA